MDLVREISRLRDELEELKGVREDNRRLRDEIVGLRRKVSTLDRQVSLSKGTRRQIKDFELQVQELRTELANVKESHRLQTETLISDHGEERAQLVSQLQAQHQDRKKDKSEIERLGIQLKRQGDQISSIVEELEARKREKRQKKVYLEYGDYTMKIRKYVAQQLGHVSYEELSRALGADVQGTVHQRLIRELRILGLTHHDFEMADQFTKQRNSLAHTNLRFGHGTPELNAVQLRMGQEGLQSVEAGEFLPAATRLMLKKMILAVGQVARHSLI